jgi:hypothetical protein
LLQGSGLPSLLQSKLNAPRILQVETWLLLLLLLLGSWCTPVPAQVC